MSKYGLAASEFEMLLSRRQYDKNIKSVGINFDSCLSIVFNLSHSFLKGFEYYFPYRELCELT